MGPSSSRKYLSTSEMVTGIRKKTSCPIQPVVQIPGDFRVYRPTKYDVLCGRGKPIQDHTGNLRMRKIVARYTGRYFNSRKHKKQAIVEEVVRLVKSSDGIMARFLKRVGRENYWVEVSNSVACDKVSHALRCQVRKGESFDLDPEDDSPMLGPSKEDSEDNIPELAASEHPEPQIEDKPEPRKESPNSPIERAANQVAKSSTKKSEPSEGVGQLPRQSLLSMQSRLPSSASTVSVANGELAGNFAASNIQHLRAATTAAAANGGLSSMLAPSYSGAHAGLVSSSQPALSAHRQATQLSVLQNMAAATAIEQEARARSSASTPSLSLLHQMTDNQLIDLMAREQVNRELMAAAAATTTAVQGPSASSSTATSSALASLLQAQPSPATSILNPSAVTPSLSSLAGRGLPAATPVSTTSSSVLQQLAQAQALESLLQPRSHGNAALLRQRQIEEAVLTQSLLVASGFPTGK